MASIQTTINFFSRKCRFGLALFTVVVGFAVMWGSSVGGARKRSAFEDAAAKAVEIDTSAPDRANNGKLIVAEGKLSSDELLGDEFITPGRYVVLQRRVEMYQWYEQKTPTGPSYELGWFEGENDSFSFQVPSGHENPLLKIFPEKKRASTVRFGGFDGAAVVDAITTLTPLRLEPSILRASASETSDNKIVVRRASSIGGPYALGDMRVFYEALPEAIYTVVGIQNNERALLGSESSGESIIVAGKASAQEILDEAASQAERGFGSLLLLGGGILFIGLVSLLSPFAAKIDLRPTVNVRGMVGVFILAFGISAVIATVFAILGLVG